MRLSKVVKVAMAVTAVSVYFFVPAYRYYVLGSYIGYKILKDKPRKPSTVKPGTKAYIKLMGA